MALPQRSSRTDDRAARARALSARVRLALVEEITAEREPAACGDLVLRWLARHAGLEMGLCAVVDPEAGRLGGLTGIGVAAEEVEAFGVRLDDRNHPLVMVLEGTEAVVFHSRGSRFPETPLAAVPFAAAPLHEAATAGGPGLGLLLLALPDGEQLPEEAVEWAAGRLANRLAALGHRRIQEIERRHRREVEWLSGILEAVTDPILLTDADGRMLIANASAEKLFTADDQMSEGRRRAVALNNMLLSASVLPSSREDSASTRREVLLVDPIDGGDLLFELLSTPFRIGKGETGLVSILHNVTDLRRVTQEMEENFQRLRAAEAKTRSERDRLDLILNSALDPILVSDAGGRIELMNAPAERLFTVAPGTGDETERRVRANDAVLSSFASNLYTGQVMRFRGELSLTDPQSGDSVPVQAISGKVAGKPGEESAVVTILHDLSESMEKARLYEQVKRHSEELQRKVREATAELAEQNELLRRQALELEQASALKSQFLANVSHELRTPLNAIVGYTSLLLEGIAGPIAERQREKLERLESNAQHLLSVINDLLDLTRIESGKMTVKLERFRLPELVREVVAEVEPLVPPLGVELRFEVPEDLPELRSDRQKVKQILLNFLANALKFTSEGWVSIRARHDRARDRIGVSVSDTGIGISEEAQLKIFEAFGRGDNVLSRRPGGAGLGLSICRRLAELLGGAIELASSEGEGSTFTLHLPRWTRKP